jgi:tripartite-type tricarboxylate transporter receptor subunit TctC
VLTASAKTPWHSWKELLEDAKKRPNQITVGATLGSTSHFFPALVEKAAGIKFKYVSYDGLAPRMNALLGGHIDLTDSNLTQKGKVDAGLLRFIAIASEKRDAEMPDVPTLKELGINVVYEVSRGLMVPKGTPQPVRTKLEQACVAAAAEPAFAEAMKKQGTRAEKLDAKAYAEFLKKNDAENKQITAELGLLKR